MKKQGPTHSPEHVHSFTFHFFCLSRENLSFENDRKIRLGFGGGEILPHLRELEQVMPMVRIVSSCLTFFVLEVCWKNQRIRTFEGSLLARVFEQNLFRGWRRSGLGWACVIFAIHTIFSVSHPSAHLLHFLTFLTFSFFVWLVYFFSTY